MLAQAEAVRVMAGKGPGSPWNLDENMSQRRMTPDGPLSSELQRRSWGELVMKETEAAVGATPWGSKEGVQSRPQLQGWPQSGGQAEAWAQHRWVGVLGGGPRLLAPSPHSGLLCTPSS